MCDVGGLGQVNLSNTAAAVKVYFLPVCIVLGIGRDVEVGNLLVAFQGGDVLGIERAGYQHHGGVVRRPCVGQAAGRDAWDDGKFGDVYAGHVAGGQRCPCLQSSVGEGEGDELVGEDADGAGGGGEDVALVGERVVGAGGQLHQSGGGGGGSGVGAVQGDGARGGGVGQVDGGGGGGDDLYLRQGVVEAEGDAVGGGFGLGGCGGGAQLSVGVEVGGGPLGGEGEGEGEAVGAGAGHRGGADGGEAVGAGGGGPAQGGGGGPAGGGGVGVVGLLDEGAVVRQEVDGHGGALGGDKIRQKKRFLLSCSAS